MTMENKDDIKIIGDTPRKSRYDPNLAREFNEKELNNIILHCHKVYK